MSEEQLTHAAAVRTMLDAIEDVAGVKGRDMVLHHAGMEEYVDNPPPLDMEEVFLPASHYRTVCKALMEVFGKGSRALLLYAGEGTIYRTVEAVPGAFASAMKFVPGGLRKKAALKMAAMETEKVTGIRPKVEYKKDKVIYHYYDCPFCEGFESDEPMCFFGAGVLKAFVQ